MVDDCLDCPLCSAAGKHTEMQVIPKESDRFHHWQDKFGYQFHFFAECPKCGSKLLGYGRG
jgi:hypothetical protein